MAHFDIVDNCEDFGAVLRLIGVGGCGGNVINYIDEQGIDGVQLMSVNTDAQALKRCKVKTLLRLGSSQRGLGAGNRPEAGRKAAEEDRDRLRELIEGCDMLFITAGMGGGTGTGAAPVIAQIARELKILTVAVVATPFDWEGQRRIKNAESGIDELRQRVDSLIVVPNSRLEKVFGPSQALMDAFDQSNMVLEGAVRGIADLITRPGMINVDFADVQTVMSEQGIAMMGSGEAEGETRARDAANAAICSPLLEDLSLQGARGIIVNITANDSVTLSEFNEIGNLVSAVASEDAHIVSGLVIDNEMQDRIRVTLVATGLSQDLGRPRKAGLETIEAQAQAGDMETPGDYSRFDKPTILRLNDNQRSSKAEAFSGLEDKRTTEYDTPAFLRRLNR